MLRNFFDRRKILATGLLVFALTATATLASAQTKTIDKLKHQLSTSRNPRQQLAIMFSLCEQNDSFAADTSLSLALKTNRLAKQLNEREAVFKSAYYIARSYNTKGKVDTALQICNAQLAQIKKPGAYPQTYNLLWWLKGNCLIKKRMIKEAQGEAFSLLNNATAQHDTLGQFNATSLIGWVYANMKLYRQSLDWFFKALHTSNDSSFYKKHCQIYFNIAAVYGTINQEEKAELFLTKAFKLAEASDNLTQQISCLEFRASIDADRHHPELAEQEYKNALDLQRKMGDPFYTIAILANFADFYVEQGQPKKAIALCNEGIRLAKQYALSGKLLTMYLSLAVADKALKDYKSTISVQDTIISLKDSIDAKSSMDALAALQVKYDVQQKENTIVKQKLSIIQRNIVLAGVLVLVLALIIVLYRWFGKYRSRQKVLMKEMLEGEKRLSGEAVTAAEEKERKRIATNLHDNLGVYAASIAANIEQIVSKPLKENRTALAELNHNSQYMIAQLSDTIWALNTEALPLTEVSDRLKVFIQRVQPSHPAVEIEVAEEINIDYELSSSQAFHLFQIIQEAVTNALKYSGCSKIDIVIESNTNWNIQVKDNGGGMTMKNNNYGGHGLKNMRTRAAEAGWSIDWLANRPSGTCVLIKNT